MSELQEYEKAARWFRHATDEDYDTIASVYSYARLKMIQGGNPRQWGTKYPLPERIHEDIDGRHTILLVDDAADIPAPSPDVPYAPPVLRERRGEHERVIGIFSVFHDPDPDYKVIDGDWLDDLPYTTIHRVASSGLARHAAADLLTWSKKTFGNVRCDTGLKNHAMQHILESQGFTRCGNIIMPENDEIENVRVAYQWNGRTLVPSAPSRLAERRLVHA